MKVAMISNFPAYSGTGKVIFKTQHFLKELGLAEADLYLTQFIRDDDRRLPENKGIKVLLPFNFLQSPFLSRFLFYFVDPHLLPSGYDIYHLGNHMMGRFVPFRRPCVVTVHDLLQFYYPEQFKNPIVARVYNYFMEASLRTLSQADHLICVSEYARLEVFKFLKGFDPAKTSLVYNGLNHSIFCPRSQAEARQILNLPKDRRILLHVGSEIRKKQIPLLLHSFRILKEKFTDLILLRCGEKTVEMDNFIRELGLEKEVIYREFNDEENMAWVYNSANLLAQTSKEEGFGFPVIEAMACGLPVVSSNFTSLGEVCGGAQAGIIESFDEGHLADVLARVLRMDEPQLTAVKARGIKNAQRFTWEKTARAVFAVYEKVIQRN